ncbi:peptidase MA family metallohydrolase [Chloroflexota bacterium]
MINKAGLLILFIYLLLSSLNPGVIHAQGEISLVNSSAEAVFPDKLNFSLSVESNAAITDIRLRYIVNRTSFANVTSETYILFEPSSKVDVSWALDMVKISGLPPGSNVDYWWLIKNIEGNKVETSPVRVRFDDNRNSWQSITEDKITIYWYEGNQSFVQELMTLTQQSLNRLADNTGAYLEKPVKMYIYANSKDLKGGMIYPQDWTGGVAFTRFNTLAISIAPDDFSWAEQVIPHELTHLVIDQMTLNPYNDLPTWLDEGLAMYNEGELEPNYKAYLYKAVVEDTLITVRSLSSPFSAYASEAALSYAQSYSFLEYLINTHNQSKMLELLNTFRQGSGYDEALIKVYGFDMDGLDMLWRDYIKGTENTNSLKTTEHSLMGALALFNTKPVIAFGIAR